MAHHAVLDRPVNRGAELQWLYAAEQQVELLFEYLLESRAHLVAQLVALGHDHRLGEVGVLQLYVNWQVEANGAGTDIERVTLDVGIARQHLLEALDLRERRLRQRTTRATPSNLSCSYSCVGQPSVQHACEDALLPLESSLTKILDDGRCELRSERLADSEARK